MKNIIIAFLLLFFTLPALGSDRVTSLPGLGKVNDLELAGTLPVSATSSANLFFWFVASQQHPDKAPIVLWLNGGPGSTSFYGFFTENGPYSIDQHGNLKKRQYAWTTKANYLMIDQPTGVGLSFAENNSLSETKATDQLDYALQAFFKRYPNLAHHPLYLAGESYAGKYIPELATRLLAHKPQTINLQGILIGDGWVNPLLQQSANADYAYAHGLIDLKTYAVIKKLYHACEQAIQQHSPSSHQAHQVCGEIQNAIAKADGHINAINSYTNNEPNYSPMIDYLNNPIVRRALHVDPRVKQFSRLSDSVSYTFELSEQESAAQLYPALLAAGVRVLVYNGIEDGTDSNFMGTDQWLAALEWPGKNALANANTCVWYVEKDVSGYARTAMGLTQIKIRGAGHMAPTDKPKQVLDMLNRFTDNRPYC